MYVCDWSKYVGALRKASPSYLKPKSELPCSGRAESFYEEEVLIGSFFSLFLYILFLGL